MPLAQIEFQKRIVLFVGAFSCLYFLLRLSPWFPLTRLQENLNGIAWLYSTVGLIFSVVSAFTIQTQWNRWDRLVTAVGGEITNLRELLLLRSSLPQPDQEELVAAVQGYLDAVLQAEAWQLLDRGQRSAEVDAALAALQQTILNLLQRSPRRAEIAYGIFSRILTYRGQRLQYGAGHLPYHLHATILVATALVTVLAFLLAVPDIWIDYVFSLSIGLLAFLLYSVIEDLEHPYRPGAWHLTNDDYRRLRDELSVMRTGD